MEGRRRGSEAVGYPRTRSGQEEGRGQVAVEEDSKPVEADGGYREWKSHGDGWEAVEVDVGKLARSARCIEDARCSDDGKVVARGAGWYRG